MHRSVLLGVILAVLSPVPASFQTELGDRVSAADMARVREFYRLSAAVQDDVWQGWSAVPAPVLLVKEKSEFLTHHPSPPAEFKKVDDDWRARPRQFPVDFQATFPAFGPPSLIVIGDPAHTQSQTSTPWLFTLMHEHFHQLQYAQPRYFAAVEALELSNGDKTGMWMLNYPFPYDKPEVARAFRELRDLLLTALGQQDGDRFTKLAQEYLMQRRRFFSSLPDNDRKYLSFQLWQEGVARYTEVRSAEAAAKFAPTAEFAALSDYEPFDHYAQRFRSKTLDELRQADLPTWKRNVVYSFGAAEGFLLDRLRPNWKDRYFRQMLSLDLYFDER